ncbi:YdcF family protein [Saccharicrinis aurantiacus]|uniref:YdcF family protein n=1 Tax=Saccharicrinis aurantiacus TaxID=1849719 RepID=UPI00248FF2A3|nr:YdcF family protein [Saccharicrinis aurantiacus]
MFFILSKVLSFILSPIWWITVLLLCYLIFRNYKKRKVLLYAAITILLIFSNKNLFHHAAKAWEGALTNPDAIEHYDGIIVLGGFSGFQTESNRIQFYQSADRLFQAVELYKKGKADKFIFTGGSASIIVKEKQEGLFIKDYLKKLDIAEDSTLVEWESRNTHENAVETKKMLEAIGAENGKYLLVTSGFHMKRAMGCFTKEGIRVEPYTTDALQSLIPPTFADVLTPSSSALALWERLFREWVGIGVYKLKGFL